MADGGDALRWALCRARHDSWGTSVEQVVTQIDGAPLGVLSAVETGPDGKVYFAVSTEASAKNGLESALRTELIAHTGTGCVYVYDPSARTVEQVLGGVAGAAGLALSEDGRTLYVSDLGERCVWAVDADARELTAGGKNCGSFVSGLPGYPGALALDEDGILYISYRWTRSGWLEKHADSTLLRGIALRAGENIQKKLFKLPADAPAPRLWTPRRKLEADILRQRAGRLHGGVPGGKQSVFRRGRLCQPAVCKSIKRGVFYDGRVQKANRDRSAAGCDGAAGPGKAEKGRRLCGGLLVQRDRRRSHRQGLELEAAQAVYAGVAPVLAENGIWLAAQCCEHLNRAIIIEREAAEKYGWEEVCVVPRPHAGGSWATTCWKQFKDPIVVEEIRAHAGIDIGGTLIGMHLRRVAVPVRLSLSKIGEANILCARTRPKLIGGERAKYTEED